jgi:hypothetical protein
MTRERAALVTELLRLALVKACSFGRSRSSKAASAGTFFTVALTASFACAGHSVARREYARIVADVDKLPASSDLLRLATGNGDAYSAKLDPVADHRLS